MGVALVNSNGGGKQQQQQRIIQSALVNYINVAVAILLNNNFLCIAPSSLILIPFYQDSLEIMF